MTKQVYEVRFLDSQQATRYMLVLADQGDAALAKVSKWAYGKCGASFKGITAIGFLSADFSTPFVPNNYISQYYGDTNCPIDCPPVIESARPPL